MTLVVDSSALVAIMLDEPESQSFRERLLGEVGPSLLAAPNHLELLMVLAKRHEDVVALINSLLSGVRITIAPFTEDLVPIAHDAFLRFGKGRHAAGLNFGDCIAYALARSLRAPLLFKGRDFALTDIVPAL